MFNAAAFQTCLISKALFGLPLRQVTGKVASLLELAVLDWPVPDYSTLCHLQKGLAVAIAHRPGTGVLHLLIDSTGIKAEGDGEWCARKNGPSKPRQSLPGRRIQAFADGGRKIHLGTDAETLEIRAIEVTGAGVGDAPVLPELLDQIPAGQPIGKVSADGAYDIRRPPCSHRWAGRYRRHPDPPHWPPLERGYAPGPKPETPSCAPPAALAGRSGDDGAYTTDEVRSKPR